SSRVRELAGCACLYRVVEPQDASRRRGHSKRALSAAQRSGVGIPHAPERQLDSTGAMTTLPLLSTPGSMPTPAAKKWKVFFATMARHIRWARSRRTHSAFTTWQGTFGSGPRTVTTKLRRDSCRRGRERDP